MLRLTHSIIYVIFSISCDKLLKLMITISHYFILTDLILYQYSYARISAAIIYSDRDFAFKYFCFRSFGNSTIQKTMIFDDDIFN